MLCEMCCGYHICACEQIMQPCDKYLCIFLSTVTTMKDIPVVHKLLNELIFIKSTKEHPGS
jgi:hypothetical protein